MENRIYTLAIVGCGKVAIKHARAVRENAGRLRLAALVDSNAERAEAFRQANQSASEPAAAVFASIGEMLATVKPDIVAVTTPSGSHYSLAKDALLAGSHTLIEKPMTLRLDEARELEALAEAQGRLIVMGHIYRYFPLVADIKQDLAAGVYGKILNGVVTVRWGHDQAYYDSAAWRGTWAADGGVLMNQSIHALDLMCWLMDSPIKQAQGQIRRLKHQMEAEDFAAAICELESGAMLQVEGTTCTGEESQMASFYIMTETAEIEAGLRAGRPYLKIQDRSRTRGTFHYYKKALKKAVKNGLNGFKHMAHPHSAIYKDFVDCLDLPGRSPLADARSGVSSVEHILAIYRSAKTGQIQTLPLASDFTLGEMQDVLD